METEESDIYEENLERARYINKLLFTDGYLPSPIDLIINKMTVIVLNPLSFHNYDTPPKKLKLTNTGRTVILSAKWQQERAYLSDGPLLNKYIFSQIHFHWGANAMDGSEHKFDGASMPMELHAVHFNVTYRSQELAVNEVDGIAVLVYAFKLQLDPNPAFEDIVKNIPFIQNPNSSIRLNPWKITNIVRKFSSDYFAYCGSVPVSNRMHTILWIVSREPIPISQEQVSAFRSLFDKNFEPILKNCRSVHDVRGRSVFHVNPSESLFTSLLSDSLHLPDQRTI